MVKAGLKSCMHVNPGNNSSHIHEAWTLPWLSLSAATADTSFQLSFTSLRSFVTISYLLSSSRSPTKYFQLPVVSLLWYPVFANVWPNQWCQSPVCQLGPFHSSEFIVVTRKTINIKAQVNNRELI